MYNALNAFLVKPWVTGYTPYPLDFNWPGSFNPTTNPDIDTDHDARL
jgi:hypothetical protein